MPVMPSIPEAVEKPRDPGKRYEPPAVYLTATPCLVDQARASITREGSLTLTQDPHARRFGERFLWSAEVLTVSRSRHEKRSGRRARGASRLRIDWVLRPANEHPEGCEFYPWRV